MSDQHKPEFKIHVGELFPDVSLSNQNNEMVRLYEIDSEYISLFFYPEDDTPTCTKEACGIRDNLNRLKDYKVTIFGISPDDAKSHQKFIQKFALNYDLLCDPDHQLALQLGIWGKKFTFGREYVGLHRVSYVLNKDKRIHKIIYPVESQVHSQQIIDCLA